MLRLIFVLALATTLLTAPAQSAPPAPEDPDTAGRKLLAENLAQLAQLNLSIRAITPETVRQSLALLKAARKLNPDEVRFARLLGEAALQAGDTDTAIDAYTTINKRLDPDDRVVQIKLIDLHLARMDTADAQLNYLVGDEEAGRKGIYNSELVAAEVRAHAAYLASRIHLERAAPEEALGMLEEALRLCPLSPEALKLKYDLVGTAGTPRERVALLLQMLRSNPSQPGVMTLLASELAAVSLHDTALSWYGQAIGLAQRYGRSVTQEELDDYLALLIVTGQFGAADAGVDQLLKNDPMDVEAAFMGLIVARLSGDADKLEKANQDAQQALLGRAQFIHDQLTAQNAEAPADPDAAVALPGEVNVPEDVKKLLELGNPQLTAAYASTLADLAWLNLYFRGTPDPAEVEKLLANLRQLLPAESVTLARLEGWLFLTSGRPQEARVKLSAVADRDPLAALGMVALLDQDPATRDRATDEARRLMNENASGLLGAIIHDALRDKKPKLAPGEQPALSEDALAVKSELDAFPKEWMTFLERPQDFYLLRGEPLKVSHKFGEPIIARVTVRNTGKHDITVGPDGAIKPDLWFDVSLRGIVQQGVQGVAFDRLTQQVILKPGQQMQQIVQTTRVDQGQLLGMLQQAPTVTFPLYFSVFTNPLIHMAPAPGPGGRRESFTKVVSRAGISAKEGLGETMRDLVNGTPDVKMRSAGLGLWFVRQMGQQEDEKMRAQAGEVLNVLRKVANDPNPQVRAWAGYLVAPIFEPELRKKALQEMLGDSAWEARMMGVLVAQSFEPSEWKTLIGEVADSDPEPVVQELASAIVDFADNPAATQPVTPENPEDENLEPAAPMAQP